MDRFVIPWETGTGNIIVENNSGAVRISSTTTYTGVRRSQVLTFKTTKGGTKTAALTVYQIGSHIYFVDKFGKIRTDRNGVAFCVKRK